MALYEGIALIQEKQAVVLDIGSEYTKFGFTGEAAPRCIVRSQFYCPALRRHKRVFDYRHDIELYDNLVHMLHSLYYRHVLVNPKERRVVVVESLLTPTSFRETLAKVLFTHYEVSGVAWADSPRLCALTLGAPAALVLEIGAREAEVSAVVHGCVVLRALQAAPRGMLCVRAELARLLAADGAPALGAQTLDDIMGKDCYPDCGIIIQEIHEPILPGNNLYLLTTNSHYRTVKTCLVTTRERALQWASDSPPTPAKSVRYPFAGAAGDAAPEVGDATPGVGDATPGEGDTTPGVEGAVTVSGRARELSAEPLFAKDGEFSSLQDLLLQCIMQCPIDCRRALAENILVCGGGAALPGLRARLRDELKHALTEPPYSERLHLTTLKFHSAPAHPNSVAWLGGALLLAGAGGGGAGAEGGRAGSRDQWLRSRRLRDWVCLLDNTPPQHPARDHHLI